MSNQVTETHARTIAKLAVYKFMSIFVAYFLSLAFGANTMQALTMSLAGLTIGSVHYYLYDRLSLYVKWGRTPEGHDTTLRSIVKTIVYRITVVMVTMIIARMVFLDSTWTAFVMASIKFVAYAIAYFIIERGFDRLQWGKKSKEIA
jgi:small-conductance mechanosensitive channel